MTLIPELKRQIRAIMQKRSPEFLMELKKRINKMKQNDRIN